MTEYPELLQEVSSHKKIPLNRLLNNASISLMRQTQQLRVVIHANGCGRPRFRLNQHNLPEDLLRTHHLAHIKHPHISLLTAAHRHSVPYDRIDLFAQFNASIGLLPDHILITVDQTLKTHCFD